MNEIQLLKAMVEQCGRIVFFGGAGVSTESGIPDFRSVDGLYHQKYRYPPETILSHEFFLSHTEEFFEFYRSKMLRLDAQPNEAHRKLAAWEAEGKLTAVITQNIDGLHQLAGSDNVFELHGSIHRNNCMDCGKLFNAQHILKTQGIPRCECGGVIKPDVVLYGEALQSNVIHEAIEHLLKADMLIVGGTSLAVYPAAGLIEYYRGDKLVLINKSPTPYDANADLLIPEKIGSVFSQI